MNELLQNQVVENIITYLLGAGAISITIFLVTQVMYTIRKLKQDNDSQKDKVIESMKAELAELKISVEKEKDINRDQAGKLDNVFDIMNRLDKDVSKQLDRLYEQNDKILNKIESFIEFEVRLNSIEKDVSYLKNKLGGES